MTDATTTTEKRTDVLHSSVTESIARHCRVRRQMSRIDMSVRCPYYIRSKSDEVVCEGIDGDMRCHNTFNFPSEADRIKARQDYMRRFCCGDYESCVLAKALGVKYEQIIL